MLDTDIKLDKKLPNISDFKSFSSISDDWFGWDLSDEQIADHIRTYGFVYKCIADNTSNPSEWLSFDSAIGRNVISAIYNHHESHLLSGTLTIMYPENGLSPNAQSAFISMLINHPQAKNVKEVRIVTRSAWFLSDCKSVMVIHPEQQATSHNNSEYFAPEYDKSASRNSRLKILRQDPFFNRQKQAIFFNLAKNEEDTTGIYLAEDEYFVYWVSYKKDRKIMRTDHLTMWHHLNAVLLNNEQCDDILPLIERGASKLEIREHLRKLEI